MQDLSHELGISKKTIYAYFEDKKDLVYQVVAHDIKQEQEHCESLFATNENAIQKMIVMSHYMNETLKEVNPSTLYDLKKYYPKSWDLFQNHSHEFIRRKIVENIQEGMEQKLFRPVNPEIIASIYLSLIDAVLKAGMESLSRKSLQDAHLEMIQYHLRGISSPKGLEYLEHHINEI